MTEQELEEVFIILEDNECKIMPGFDAAIIGVVEDFEGTKALYSLTKVIEHMCVKDGMSEEEAVDWYQFNIIRSYGEHMPVFLIDYFMEEEQ